jgi:hypothetical protein
MQRAGCLPARRLQCYVSLFISRCLLDFSSSVGCWGWYQYPPHGADKAPEGGVVSDTSKFLARASSAMEASRQSRSHWLLPPA